MNFRFNFAGNVLSSVIIFHGKFTLLIAPMNYSWTLILHSLISALFCCLAVLHEYWIERLPSFTDFRPTKNILAEITSPRDSGQSKD